MSRFSRFQSWLKASLFRSRVETEMESELRFHMEQHAEHLMRDGESPEEARRIAAAEFGGVDRSKEECRDALGLRFWDETRADVRHALRQMRRAPALTIVALLSIALGIGANAAIFSIFDAKIFRKLPVKDPDQLVMFQWVAKKWGPHDFTGTTPTEGSHEGEPWRASTYFSQASLEAFRTAPSMSDVIARAFARTMIVTIDGNAERLKVQAVSTNFFSVLGVPMFLGRGLVPEDDQLAAPAVTVISQDFWKRRFASNPSIIGKTLTIGNVPLTIVGVTPQEFRASLTVAGISPELSIPLHLYAAVTGRAIRHDTWWLQLIGRMKPGFNLNQVRGNLEGTFQGIAAEAAADSPGDVPRFDLYSGSRGFTDLGSNRDISTTLVTVSIVFGLLLLIVCLNVANLMLARGAARQGEMGIRTGLGASRGRLIRQLLTENLLISVLGTALGLVLANSWKALLNSFLGSDGQLVQVDGHVLAFAVAAAVLTTLIFGLGPALQTTRTDVASSVKRHDLRLMGPRSPLGKCLLVLQVAMSVPLLIGAGLLLRTIQNVPQLQVGFDKENILLFSASVTDLRYNSNRATALYDQMIERIKATPGVLGVTASTGALGSGSFSKQEIRFEDDKQFGDRTIRALAVRPSFFEVLGIPIIRGRGLTSQDPILSTKSNAPPAPGVVNESLSRRYFPDGDALGKHFRMQPTNNRSVMSDVEIVGIVKDVTAGFVRDPAPTVFTMDPNVSTFEVRTAGSPLAAFASIRQTVRDIDPNVPLLDIKTEAEQLLDGFSDTNSISLACSLFGGVALVLTSIGLYGLLSFNVAKRTNEIGLRMALGARRADVLRLVFSQTLGLVMAGCVTGLALSYAFRKTISGLIFGIRPTDPVTIISVMVILLAVTGASAWIPARTACRIDPVSAIRTE